MFTPYKPTWYILVLTMGLPCFSIVIIRRNNDILLLRELGNINYTIVTGYKIDGLSLNEARLAVGFPKPSKPHQPPRLESRWGSTILVYHSSETRTWPSILKHYWMVTLVFPDLQYKQTVQAHSWWILSTDEIVDQITLNFVVPDAISVLSWIRELVQKSFLHLKAKRSVSRLDPLPSSPFLSLKENASSEMSKQKSPSNPQRPRFLDTTSMKWVRWCRSFFQSSEHLLCSSWACTSLCNRHSQQCHNLSRLRSFWVGKRTNQSNLQLNNGSPLVLKGTHSTPNTYICLTKHPLLYFRSTVSVNPFSTQ